MKEQGWVYTWESQAQIPALKLFLFNPCLNNHPLPDLCLNPSVHLLPSRGSLLLSLTFCLRGSSSRRVELVVPSPSAVLIDPDVPPSFRVLHDHFEVRLSLLLPVDHPVVHDLRRMMMADEDDSFWHSGSGSLFFLSLSLSLSVCVSVCGSVKCRGM
ncbi:hypothetical protein MLD38_029383 [Melastoma candidum]|uniref:Uncharacterized protein n=1 Tax=Melastoma candidum TaxID=119954 RepID=A0ACB9N5A8_9MYRT|nr:hypothetical protein MLD38_029383 [Melastoma candidum]